VKQSQILTAEGEKQSNILRAEGTAQAAILNAQGEARAILQVFDAIHRGNPDQKLLAYQYLQMLPQIARGDANKLWIVPSELGEALKGIGGVLGRLQPGPDGEAPAGSARPAGVPDGDALLDDAVLQDPNEALAQARADAAGASAEAEGAATEGVRPGPMPGRAAGHPGQLGDVEDVPTQPPPGDEPPTPR
jgi:hypothetical protein